MNILIVEDNPGHAKVLSHMMEQLCASLRIPLTYKIQTSLEKKQPEYVDLAFFDIEVGDTKSLSLLEQWRNQGWDIPVVLTSAHQKYLPEGYHTGAIRYLIKPLNWDVFEKEMEPVFIKLTSQEASIYDPKVSGRPVSLKAILYVEAYQHKTILHLTNGRQEECSYPLSWWEKKLPSSDFCCCTRGVLVNLNHVQKVEKRQVTLKSRISFPLSRSRQKQFLAQYTRKQVNL